MTTNQSHMKWGMCLLALCISCIACAKKNPQGESSVSSPLEKKEARIANNPLFQQWVVEDEDGSMMLYDLSDGQHLVTATTYSEQELQSYHGAFEKGVFYLVSSEKFRVTNVNGDSGDVETKSDVAIDWMPSFSYSQLSAATVTLLFEGEYEWKAKKANSAIRVVNPNTEELNVEDMTTVFNFYDTAPNVMETVCKGKQLQLLDKKNDDPNGYIYETWGRGVKANGWQITKTADDALAIHFLKKQGELTEVRIIFSNPKLIAAYEKQLAQHGYFKKKTRNVEGMQETTYASDEWTPGSDEPVYIIADDGQGLYHLVYSI